MSRWPIGANKIFSIRAWVTIILVVALCWFTDKALNAFIDNLTNKEAFDGAKEICMFLLGVFSNQVGMILASYFHKDRTYQQRGDKDEDVA